VRAWFALGLAAMMAGCGSEPAPSPAPTPSATPTKRPLPPPADIPGALPAPELQEATRPAGGWRRDGAKAIFGDASGTPLLTIDCDRARRQLAFIHPSGQGTRMKVVTDLAAVTLNAVPTDAGIAAETNAADPFLRALAKSDSAIGVQLDDGDVLAVPVEAALRNAVADCIRPY
jgi:hypothetical protein